MAAAISFIGNATLEHDRLLFWSGSIVTLPFWANNLAQKGNVIGPEVPVMFKVILNLLIIVSLLLRILLVLTTGDTPGILKTWLLFKIKIT